MTAETLILASKSAARRTMLENAGVAFDIRIADVDEEAIKAVSTDLDPAALAVRLAEAKALAVSRGQSPSPRRRPDVQLDLDGIALVNRLIQAQVERGGAVLLTTHGAYAAPPVPVRTLALGPSRRPA